MLSPPLEVFIPKENAVVNSQVVTVEGKTDPNATIFVNSDSVSLDNKGYFKKKINLFLGSTVINIKALNRFGKEKIIERHIEVRG